MIRKLASTQPGFEQALSALLAREPGEERAIEESVAAILADVRARGDAAVLEYTERFDGLAAAAVAELEIAQADLRRALDRIAPDERDALEAAAQRIRAYHARQLAASWEYAEADGTRLGQQVTAIERVGLYVPGGKAAYPSSVLMNALPAKVAGVSELTMVVPTPRGERNPLVLAAAAIAGVDRVFAIGGAQAVGALAWGTATVARVDKIVGPGNAYVAAAKRRVFGVVGIDMVAGPSEVLIIADGSSPPEWVAMDLFAQAEHDEMAQCLLLCPDRRFLDAVAAALARALPERARRDVIARSLQRRGALIAVRDLEEACAIANRVAPEHLELSVADPRALLGSLRNAGAIFLGRYTSESIGDYCAGPNHVLPTARSARFSSPLGVYDFQKRTSIIEVSADGADRLGRIASTLARGEGLEAHARAAQLRLRK